jgi:hypothetical protein
VRSQQQTALDARTGVAPGFGRNVNDLLGAAPFYTNMGNDVKIYGRKLLYYDREVDLSGVDQVVFDLGKSHQIVVNLYRARIEGPIEISTNGGLISVHPRAANVVNIRMEKT